MKAVDSRKGNTHSLANMTVIRVDISVVRNVTIKIIVRIGVALNLMNADLQCTGGNHESLDYKICTDRWDYRSRR